MTSRPRVRAAGSSTLSKVLGDDQGAADIALALRDERGAVTPPGKKGRARSRRAAAKTLREAFEQALVAQLQALEALDAEATRDDVMASLLAHARAVATRHLASAPRATRLPDTGARATAPAKASERPSLAAPPASAPSAPLRAEPRATPEHPPSARAHVIARVERATADAPPSFDAPLVTFHEGWRVSDVDAGRLRAFHPEVVLVAPQIPPNTGTVARLCGALCAKLNLVEPLGFDVSEKAVRRAGLDYWDEVDVTVHGSLHALRAAKPGRRLVLVETGGTVSPSAFAFKPGDLLVFGSETRGLPDDILTESKDNPEVVILTVPMYSSRVRSLNLANTVSMVLFAAVEDLRARFLDSREGATRDEGARCPS